MYYVGSMPAVEFDVKHYGIIGQKWGVRRYQNEDGTLTEEGKARYAKDDAKEYARAKMATGEGAGNRRKKINATVRERSKDPKYKEAFERELSKQSMAKYAKEDTRRHQVQKVKETPKKIVKGIAKTATAILAAYSAVQVIDMFSDGAASNAIKKGASKAKNILSNMGKKSGSSFSNKSVSSSKKKDFSDIMNEINKINRTHEEQVRRAGMLSREQQKEALERLKKKTITAKFND